MTLWMKFPCELEKCYYDVEMTSGHLVRHIWPLIRAGQRPTFFSHDAAILPEWLIARVRVFDESNLD